jgi:hypothetical protein
MVVAAAEPCTRAPRAQEIVKKDGVSGLFFRGLGTKLIANGMQVGVISAAAAAAPKRAQAQRRAQPP